MGKRLVGLILICALCFAAGCGGDKTIDSQAGTAEFSGSVILGRPTDTSMTASITTENETEIYLAYWEQSNTLDKKTDVKTSTLITPAVFVMDGLSADKEYHYAIYFKKNGDASFERSVEYNFSTPKAAGDSFHFVVQSDSHLLNKADPQLYKQSMQTMASLQPDLMFDLGDTFLMDNGGNDVNAMTQENVDEIYRQQLPYFDIVARSAPLFLIIGNHESEYGVLLDGTTKNIAAKSTIARTTYFLNPVPNEFYSGNTEKEPALGSPENYYAFIWGDALFVSIDPYRYSQNGASDDSKGDGWGWTLGKTQYDWFRKTLENSTAKYKFVFSHHAIGNIRGGANIATLYEWGGYDQNGNYLFDEKRPGWGKPIQQVMKDTGVTIFFQGHDHLFARETVDGVIYQTIPKPAEKIADNQTNFRYYTGDILLNSGFLDVNVTTSGVEVDYNRNYLVASGEQTTGVVYSYTVDQNHSLTVLKNTQDILENYGKNDVSADKKSSAGGKNKGANSLPSNIGTGATPAQSMSAVPLNGFSFAIEADPHFDEQSDPELLCLTAANIVSAKPEFLIDLGDTSMLEKLGKTPAEAAVRNTLVSDYFSRFGRLPIKMVTGNHDVAINTGKPNYYTFIRGNAQFIVLDPYAFSSQTVGKGGGWAATLGKTQYDWLKNTLANSRSDFKFVFIHNLTGAIGKDSRGGAEAAKFYEWGGYNEGGVYEFDKMRPGWDMPVHDLLVKYGVQVVFHGHDHFYAKQEKDGVVYQLVPQPGTPGNSVYDAASYGYQSGVQLPSAGYLRVIVLPEKATVEYIHIKEDGDVSIPNVYRVIL